MPPLIVAVLLGAGVYAGLRVAGRFLSRTLDAASDQPAGAEGVAIKDLGSLERDPATGVYRPNPRD